MSINPDKQYTTIENALKEGHRLAWKDDVGFLDITSKEASAYKELGWTTDLHTLKNKVSDFIDQNGFTIEQQTKLERAFKARAKRLSDRTVLWGRAKKTRALDELKAIEETIHEKRNIRVSEISRANIPVNIPPSSTGPAKQEIPSPFIKAEKKEENVVENTESEFGKEIKPHSPFSFSSSTEVFGAPPPPPGMEGMGGPPPPPPPMSLEVKKKMLSDQPQEPKINRTKIPKKTTNIQKEIQTIETYEKKLQEVHDTHKKITDRHDELTGLAVANSGYVEKGRNTLEGLAPPLEQLVKMYNSGKGGEITVGDTPNEVTYRLYTDQQYADEVEWRSKLSKPQRTEIDKRTPIGEWSKISYQIQVANTLIRKQISSTGKKGEKVPRLIDQNGKEIWPVEAKKSGQNYILTQSEVPKTLLSNYVSFEQARGPLQILQEEVKEDGKLISKQARLTAEKKEIEEKKYGDFGFIDLKSQIESLRGEIPKWTNARKNREKVLTGKLTTKERENIVETESPWDQLVKARPDLIKQAHGMRNFNPGSGFGKSIQLAPQTAIPNLLLMGKITIYE